MKRTKAVAVSIQDVFSESDDTSSEVSAAADSSVPVSFRLFSSAGTIFSD